MKYICLVILIYLLGIIFRILTMINNIILEFNTPIIVTYSTHNLKQILPVFYYYWYTICINVIFFIL